MKISLLLKFGVAVIALIVSGEAVAQGGGDYRFEVSTNPAGAAVFVGKTFQGVTPYQSDWVKKPKDIFFTLVRGGRTIETKYKGAPGRVTSSEVAVTPAPELSLAQANLLLEAIRASLAKTELVKEVESGFPTIGSSLSVEFKARMARMLRLSREKFLESTPLPAAVTRLPDKSVERVTWEAVKISSRSTPNDRAFDTAIGWPDGSGYHVLMVFSKQEDVWLLSNCQVLGQDYED